MSYPRKPSFPINPLFLQRWSPRGFDRSRIEESLLLQLFEAARWASSAGNRQPWRFLYALRDTPDFDTYLGLLNDYNSVWAERASALVFVLSDSGTTNAGKGEAAESPDHVFDTGIAYGQFALQATRLNLIVHAMQGFNVEKAHESLNIPRRFRINVGVTVGRQGPADHLSEFNRGREHPNGRRPLSELVASGTASEAWLTPAAP